MHRGIEDPPSSRRRDYGAASENEDEDEDCNESVMAGRGGGARTFLSAARCEYGTMLEISHGLRRLWLAADWKVRAPPPSLTHYRRAIFPIFFRRGLPDSNPHANPERGG